jgi:hypothetical protein
MIIIPYKMASESAKNISEYMNAQGIRTIRSQKIPALLARVVHWGKTEVPTNHCQASLNRLGAGTFVNKLSFFMACGTDPKVPEWTTDMEVAKGYSVCVERHLLASSEGAGIRIVKQGEALQPAPLYIKYINKTDEYRLHVFKNPQGEFYVGFHQKKVARQPTAITNWKVRNTANGFFFQQNGYEVPAVVSETALDLVQQFFPTIDFVALDVVYHRPSNSAYVLEGNTAPGLEGRSVQVYGEFFKERLYGMA